MLKKVIYLNGVSRSLIVSPEALLSDVIRKQLHLTGTKVGCGQGQCGACSVIMDGKVIRSCVTKMKRVPEGASITTIEGLGTPDNLHALQLAWAVHGGAQCGFCSPGFIVSAKGLLDQNANPTRQEVRDWFQKHRNVCRCTGYVPLVDAVMDAARVLRGEITKQELAYKLPEDGKIWGSKYPRPTAIAKVTGTCDYGADLGIKMPCGTLHLKLVQATVSHANILSIDTSEAEKMPGVYKVITHKDVIGKNRITGLITFPTNKGDGWDRPILCDEKVFQFGDAIAIVAADTEENAQAAVEKVKVELEILPAYMSAPAAMADDAIEIHPGTPNVYFEQKIAKGEDTKEYMEKAAYVVEGENFYVGRQPHLPIEPDVGLAYFDEEGRLTIHSKSIGLGLHAAMIAPGIGIELEKLRMIQNPAGGTFGYKFSPTIEALLGVAALATGKPVYLNFNYYQQITYTGKRSPFFMNLKYGADKDGKILAMESEWTVDHGPYSEFGDLLTLRGAQFIGAGYGIPNIRGIGRTVCTNHAWGSAFRGYGSPQSLFASELLMDMLAEKMGMDPLELRYKNVYRPGDTQPSGSPPEVFSLPELIDTIRPKYLEAKERAKKESTPEKKRGVGVSIGVYGCGLDGPDGAEAWAELTKEGVTIFTCWHDHGQGADIGCLSTAHEALRPAGIKPQDIKLVLNDTGVCPDGGPAGGSRSQVLVGNAIKASCDLLVAAMKKADGTYKTYDEMVAEGTPLKYVGKWAAPCKECDENAQGNPFPTYMYGVFLAEVEVDTKTGKTQVVKMTLAADPGKIGNKLAVDGQIYGGLAQGIGLALSEDFEDLKKHTTMANCGIPYIKDIPDALEILYVETPRELGPHGASGVGELPLTSPHVAITNAIYNACGVRITQLPALPEKVLAGLNALK
ncbi:molybdopterin-dependent aldehyde oxidoreductase [Desulforamulus ruminis]|uniref:Aldehyde oxidase and xanthine dehydrogenase molybdopterin binding protein n=1 Tax=Desulforamulus ruminis (strain ATCC 23193 / DSM 2154 / NCIMB 8452 / DL) TaxID=696281 RepID=F6DS46_DESRL|nr:molybdopterin-dependent aldehyde oxidoreductase [Desulforamulus ruminis]AEG58808.1 aldehyde oxidase and xanthine dehydrogenase molybdopterin binding protein [Desulforamulus ruminis DSM 2154]